MAPALADVCGTLRRLFTGQVVTDRQQQTIDALARAAQGISAIAPGAVVVFGQSDLDRRDWFELLVMQEDRTNTTARNDWTIYF